MIVKILSLFSTKKKVEKLEDCRKCYNKYCNDDLVNGLCYDCWTYNQVHRERKGKC